MITRRKFIKDSALAAGGTALALSPLHLGTKSNAGQNSIIVSVAADNILTGENYNPEVVHKVYEAGLREFTGEKTLENAWSSLVSPDDVVGIKINLVEAPRVQSSIASVNEVIAGLKRAGVKENNIIIWDESDGSFRRSTLKINRSSDGVRIHGNSVKSAFNIPWEKGYDKKVYYETEFGTLNKYRELMNNSFLETADSRQIFNSITWLWILMAQENEKALNYRKNIRSLYMNSFSNTGKEDAKKVAEEIYEMFNDVTIQDENRSYFSEIVTKDITKLIVIGNLKYNMCSGVTFICKNIALGVTSNRVRFHIDLCATAIPAVLGFPCIKDKLILAIGEAVKISAHYGRLAYDNRLFFGTDPVAMDAVGLELLEEKRKEQKLEPIRHLAGNIAACAKKGLGTDDIKKIDLRELKI